MMTKPYLSGKKEKRLFLKDVLICSLGAYGGPEAHFGVFADQMVSKSKHLTEEELVELIALCSILPGPTSSQTIVAIGYKRGGPFLAFLTMLVWGLPAIIVMSLLSFLYQFLSVQSISRDGFRYIGPMAVGFIIVAAFRIGRKVITDYTTAALLLFGGITTYFIRDPWIFPLVLIAGGTVSIIFSGQKNIWNRVRLNPPWIYLAVFVFLAVGSLLSASIWSNRNIELFEHFYRYGYLVFGGGQVVVPVMHSELVYGQQYMTNQEFLTGYGLVQGLPGPMFSFAAYASGMAARGSGYLNQIIGALTGGIGIFLPGLLLIYFVYPVWEQLKAVRGLKTALKGVNAVAGGLIAVAAVILMGQSGFLLDNIIVTSLTVILLVSKKIPVPLLVLAVLAAGFIL